MAISWNEKYEIQSLDDLVGLPNIRKSMQTFLKDPRSCGFLFIGDSGTGKTSTALAVARALKVKPDCVASEVATHALVSRILNEYRELPPGWLKWLPDGSESGRWNILIVNEIEECTLPVQRLFLAALDATQRIPRTIFFFTANTDKVKVKESGSGLERRFSSRCMSFKFSFHGSSPEVASRLKEIWKIETGLDGDDIDFDRLFSNSGKNFRGSLSELEAQWLQRGGGFSVGENACEMLVK